jgi:predicted kinase
LSLVLNASPVIVLLGGPAGTGKSTVGAAWCRSRPRAAMVELDAVRDCILGGRADPQIITTAQAEQYETSVRASAALARAFHADGYDVVVEEVFDPEVFDRCWMPLLDGLPWRLVILLASLEVTLQRGSGRDKSVMEHHVRHQHALSEQWSASTVIETTGLTVSETLIRIDGLLTTE